MRKEGAAAWEPPDRDAAVALAQCRRCAVGAAEFVTTVEDLRAKGCLRPFETRHACGIDEHGRGVLSARSVAGGGETDVFGSDLVQGQPARSCGRRSERAKHG